MAAYYKVEAPINASSYKVNVCLNAHSVTVGSFLPQKIIATLPLVGPTGATGATGPAGTTDYTQLNNVPATFAPIAHKATHQAGGTDALTPADIGAATSAQGSLADSAVQPGDLATVATTGSYSDLSNVPATFAPASHTHTPSEVGLGNVSNSAQVTSVTGTAPIVSSGGTTPAISISAATASAAGSMSGADKTKLDGIATSANNYTHPNHSGDVTSVGDGATTIANDAVTNAKLANVTTQTIKGRATASTGDPEDLTASQVRTILNVADGAEVNVQSNWTEANSGSDAFIQNKPTLGGAAALNVGTTASTVAAGDDSRFTDAASLTTGTLADARLSGGVSRVMHAIAVGFVLH